MKSQVNACLHVMRGVCKDVLSTYPELEVGILKDIKRVTLLCRDRGLGVFTLDLPHLESLLLKGLEDGRLDLHGPLVRVVSSKTQVPRLFSGLWLRIFDKSSCLKRVVDINSLFFLRQLLVIGKKLEVGCSYNRIRATIESYNNVESQLYRPDLNWSGTELGYVGTQRGDNYRRLWGTRDPADQALFEEVEESEESSDLESSRRVERHERLSLSLTDHPALIPPLPLLENVSPRDWVQDLSDLRLLEHTQRVADYVTRLIPEPDPISFGICDQSGLIRFKHGPGAVADRVPKEERSIFRTWSAKLQSTFPWEYCGTSLSTSFGPRPLNHEVPSRLLCVPKTRKGPRLIASESTPHQWCQQLMLSFYFRHCSQSLISEFIDFSDQDKSGQMVLAASRDKSLATVDLSDASDRLSCWTVERLLRKNIPLLDALHAARTRYIRDENLGVPNFLILRKFASQGTAVTFPTMSVCKLIISLGACTFGMTGSIDSRVRKMIGRVRVFGDDIIIPRHGYGHLCRLMDLLQLKVNVAKSYVSGNYRESCGVDGFCGYDVTPVKPKTLSANGPERLTSLIDTSNNLFMKGLWHAADAVRSLIPYRIQRCIRINGIDRSGFPGFTSYVGTSESHLKSRWNPDYQRLEVRTLQISVRDIKKPRDGQHLLLDFWSKSHSPLQSREVSVIRDDRRTIFGPKWGPSLI